MICTQHCPRLSPCLIPGLEPGVPRERWCGKGKRRCSEPWGPCALAESSAATKTQTHSRALRTPPQPLFSPLSPRPMAPGQRADTHEHKHAHASGRLCSRTWRVCCASAGLEWGHAALSQLAAPSAPPPPHRGAICRVVNKHEAPRWEVAAANHRWGLPRGRGQLHQRGGPGRGTVWTKARE